MSTDNGMPTDKIFVADKSEVMCELIKCHLEHDGYASDTTTDADTFTDTDFAPYKAIILDYDMLAGETCDYVESHSHNGDTCDVAVIVTYSPEADAAIAVYDTLDAGADAVLRKPFSMKELTARIKSVLRRRVATAARTRVIRSISHDSLMIDLTTRTVSIDDVAVDMPPYATEVLAFLMSHHNDIFSADKLGASLWPDYPERHTEVFISPIVENIKQRIGRYASYLSCDNGYTYCHVD